MGSKLQHSRHLLISLLKHNSDVAASVSKSQDTWIDFKKRSMDRLSEKNNRECVRNTMLRQEQIFKNQVRELHRLYQVQKLQTAKLRTKEAKFHSVASTSTSETSHSSYINGSLHQNNTLAEEYPVKNKGFDLEQPVEEEMWVDEECDVELRLSIGGGTQKKKSKR